MSWEPSDLEAAMRANPTLAALNPALAPNTAPTSLQAELTAFTPGSRHQGANHDEFIRQVIDLAREHGWRAYAVLGSKHHARVTHAGWPDLVLWRPPRLIVAELKTGTGRPSVDQARTLLELAACGLDARIWTPDDLDQIREVLA